MENVSLDRGRWAPATRSAYTVAWSDWQKWCAGYGVDALPGTYRDVAIFLEERAATHSTSTISTRLSAIKAVHKLYGFPFDLEDNEIRDVWAEIRRTKGTANKPKAALATEDLKRVIRGIPADRLQERAVLLLGFASAMRRSELVALNREDLEFGDTDLTIKIRRSKTDKTGKGEVICVARYPGSEFCPVAALEAWLTRSGTAGGAIFISRQQGARMAPRTVADIAKRWAKNAGFDPIEIGAHSLRRGCITAMFEAGTNLKDVMTHSRHKSSEIALHYVQAKRASENPAIRALGL